MSNAVERCPTCGGPCELETVYDVTPIGTHHLRYVSIVRDPVTVRPGSAPGYSICAQCGTGGYGYAQHCPLCCTREVAGLKRDVASLTDQLDHERNRMHAPGLWIVRERPGHRSERLYGRLDDLPDAIPLAAIALHEQAIASVIVRERELVRDGAASDIAEAIVRGLFEAEREGR